MPKTKGFLTIIIIIVAVSLVGGFTMAFFASSDTIGLADFQVGTLLIEANNTAIGNINWNLGDDNEEIYTITNVGTKSSLIRAKLEGQWYRKVGEVNCESATARMVDDPDNFEIPYREKKNPWFTYIKDTPNNSTSTFYFYAGQHYKVGEVDVSKSEGFLNIDIRLLDGFDFNVKDDGELEVHINIAADRDTFMDIQGQPWSFGNWPFPDNSTLYTYDQATNTYSYSIPWESVWDNQELFIGVHGKVCGNYDDNDYGLEDGEWVEWDPPVGSVTIEPCENSGWRYGTDEYLYYVGTDNPDCLKIVKAGDTIELCINVTLDYGSGSVFQNKKFILNASFEAIQISNRAAIEQNWEFTSCLFEDE